MLNSSFTDPGSFFGLMCLCAAHRAVLSRPYPGLMNSSRPPNRVLHDPDYYMMKANCIRAVNRRMRDQGGRLTREAFDTIIALLTSTVWSNP